MTNKEINKKQRQISKELKQLSDYLKDLGFKDYHNKARSEINIRYGKGWREELEMKKTY